MQDQSLPSLDPEEMQALLHSPAGQKLQSLLQQNATLKSAAEKAAAGDYDHAKNAIQSFLKSPEGKDLLEKIKER